MASQSMSNPASRNTSTAAEIPAKISPSNKNLPGAGDKIGPTAKAKNVTLGKDSGSTLSIKPGLV